jgi:DNA-binding NtrC family response regulator
MLPQVSGELCGVADMVRGRSTSAWGVQRAVQIVGRSPALVAALEQLRKFAAFDEPVLLTGESGVGKELAAQAVHLLSPRRGPLVSVNCPQYREGNLTVSELFGHEKGSFTGAFGRRHGCFVQAEGGTVFLDEVADLHMDAQVMLLRALSSREIQPLGAERPQRIDVRVVAATNRPLKELIESQGFRQDLYYRLCNFEVEIPPLRERGDDWVLLLDRAMRQLVERYGERKRFSARSIDLLSQYDWPGNVRELLSLATIGYAMCDGRTIVPSDVEQVLRHSVGAPSDPSRELLDRMTRGEASFWDAVHRPFLDRDLNRSEVRRVVATGLRLCSGSYQELLSQFGLEANDYQRFMDFLRHHRLKPEASNSGDHGPSRIARREH